MTERIPASENVFTALRMAEGAAPATPPTGEVIVYPKADGLLYWKDEAGLEHAMGGAGGDVFDAPNFTDAARAGWTNIGANITTLDMNTTVPGHAYIKVTPPNTTTFGWVGAYRAWAPVAGSTFTVKVRSHKIAAQFHEIGIFAADAAGQKASCFGIYGSNAGGTITAYHWRDYSTLLNAVNDGAAGAPPEARFGLFWLRIKWNSSASLDFQYSHDGWRWLDAFTAHPPAAAFTTNAAGIYLMPYGSTTPMEGVFANWALT